MARTAKNYKENGGDVSAIGGILKILDGAEIQNANGDRLIANQANSVATDVSGLVSDFNALLTKLKASGLMVADV